MGQEFSDETIIEDDDDILDRPDASKNSRMEEEEESDIDRVRTFGIVMSKRLQSFRLLKNFDVGTTTGKLLQTPGCKKCWSALFSKELQERVRNHCRNRIFIHGKVTLKAFHSLACRWRCEDYIKSFEKPVDSGKLSHCEVCRDCGGPCSVVQLKVVEPDMSHIYVKPRKSVPLQVFEEPAGEPVNSVDRSGVPRKKKKKKKKVVPPVSEEDPSFVARRFQMEEDEELARRLQNNMYQQSPASGNYERVQMAEGWHMDAPIQQQELPPPSVPEAPEVVNADLSENRSEEPRKKKKKKKKKKKIVPAEDPELVRLTQFLTEEAERRESSRRKKKKKKKKKKKTVPASEEDPALVARRFQMEEDEEAARRLQNEMYHRPPGSYESEPIQQPPTPSVPEAPSPIDFMGPVNGVEMESPVPKHEAKKQTPTQGGFMMPVSGVQIMEEESEDESGEESEDEEENKCIVCKENTISLVMIPCGHVSCNDCNDEVDECPFCSRVIVKRVKFNNYFV